tara:strand:+ start:1660 stop:2118 length:459 start_codon:yes stop_codon:yes gene_type:complete
MPVSYTNIIKTKILEPIRLLIRNEFGASYNTYIGTKYENRGTQSIRLECIRQELSSQGSHGYENQYTVEISLYLNMSNYEDKVKMDKLYNDVSRLEQILHNKRDPVSRSNDDAFYSGDTVSISFNEKDEDEDDIDSLVCAKLEYLCYFTKMS